MERSRWCVRTRGRDRHRQWPKRHSVLLDVIGLRGSHVNSQLRHGRSRGRIYVHVRIRVAIVVGVLDETAETLSATLPGRLLLRTAPLVDLRGIPRSVRGNKGLLPRWPTRGRRSFVRYVSRESCMHARVRAACSVLSPRSRASWFFHYSSAAGRIFVCEIYSRYF